MKIVFYHVPKTGGTAIYQMTKNWNNFRRAHPRKNHVCVAYYPPKLTEYGMAVIRHPYTRFESAFYHMVDSCNDNFYYRHANQSDCNKLRKIGISNFGQLFQENPNVFLYALMNKNAPEHKQAKKVFHTFDIFKSQFYWLSDIFGFQIHPGINIILNKETLESEFNTIAYKLGKQPQWNNNHSNARITQINIPLTEESKAIIRKLYYKDFKFFKFRM